MKKFWSSGLIVFAGMVAQPAGISPQRVPTSPASDCRTDSRLETLRRFFQKCACPAEKYSRVFLEAADDYALDWRLLPSISFIESTGGKAAPNNNLFGWDSGRAHFPSPAAGIHAVAYHLAHSVLYKDKNLDGLLATYNHRAEYGQKVKFVMRRIAPSE
jgi:hypothetical protein